jgi:hypothetical protein
MTPDLLEYWGMTIAPPDYYTAEYTMDEQNIIVAQTQKTAQCFGYNMSNSQPLA